MKVYGYRTNLDRNGVDVPGNMIIYLSTLTKRTYTLSDSLVVPGVTRVCLPASAFLDGINYLVFESQTVGGLLAAGISWAYFADYVPSTDGTCYYDLTLDSWGTVRINGTSPEVTGNIIRGHVFDSLSHPADAISAKLPGVPERVTPYTSLPFYPVEGRSGMIVVFAAQVKGEADEKMRFVYSTSVLNTFDSVEDVAEFLWVLRASTTITEHIALGTDYTWQLESIDSAWLVPAFVHDSIFPASSDGVVRGRAATIAAGSAIYSLWESTWVGAGQWSVTAPADADHVCFVGNGRYMLPVENDVRDVPIIVRAFCASSFGTFGFTVEVDGVVHDFTPSLLIGSSIASRDVVTAQEKIASAVQMVSAAGTVVAGTASMIATGGQSAPVAVPAMVSAVGGAANNALSMRERENAGARSGAVGDVASILFTSVTTNILDPTIQRQCFGFALIKYDAANLPAIMAQYDRFGYDLMAPLAYAGRISYYNTSFNQSFFRFSDVHVKRSVLVPEEVAQDLERRLMSGMRFWYEDAGGVTPTYLDGVTRYALT